jgi:hypothetical protein
VKFCLHTDFGGIETRSCQISSYEPEVAGGHFVLRITAELPLIAALISLC